MYTLQYKQTDLDIYVQKLRPFSNKENKWEIKYLAGATHLSFYVHKTINFIC